MFDLVILVILAVCAIRGASKGLLYSLCGLLALFVAFAGATIASRTLAPMVAEALEPKFAAVIEEKLEEEIASHGVNPEEALEALPLQELLEILRGMGFYEVLIDQVTYALEGGALTVAANAAATVAAAVAQSVASYLIFFVVFVILSALWSVLSHSLNLVTRLPGIHFLNKTGGAVFGLLKACVVLFAAAWAVQFLGNLIPEEAVQETHLLKFFMTTNPIELLLGLSKP